MLGKKGLKFEGEGSWYVRDVNGGKKGEFGKNGWGTGMHGTGLEGKEPSRQRKLTKWSESF